MKELLLAIKDMVEETNARKQGLAIMDYNIKILDGICLLRFLPE